MAFAQAWRSKERPEQASTQLASDVHSPMRWRAIGAASNLPEFHAAFGIQPGDPMYRAPEARPDIW